MAQWWLVSSSSENGKPWNVITFQGTLADAQGEGLNVGGFPKGPFASAAAAVAWGKANNVPVINDPNASSGNPITQAGAAITDSANSAAHSVGLSGVAAIGDFFQRLTQENTWIRVGEVTLGILLIISGIMKLSGAGGDIKDIAKVVRP